jgi:succinate dehydrogenase/fumarate reductase flavoprotein subunit
VAKRLANHIKELLLYRRGIHVTSGNALAARLAHSALKLGVPIWTSASAKQLLDQAGRVTGAVISREGVDHEVQARHGVVLACGGFPHDVKRITLAYPHLRRGGEHLSPVPTGNTGDGIRLAEQLGGRCEIRFPSASAWMPVSKVPYSDGSFGVFPHLLDRYKPGIIGVTRKGLRFCNESESYHDVGAAMIKACEAENETAMWLICDQATLSRYGLGFVKPAPMPIGRFLKNGYLMRGRTLAELATVCGIDGAALQGTVDEYNVGARQGVDAQFGRGTTSFNRYLADPEHKPNPYVAPVQHGPFYAVKVVMGDLGTFDGLSTTPQGEVVTADGQVIAGLYAVGNDRASMMGGNYPGAGITLGPNMTFGWLAGRLIAERAKAAASGAASATAADTEAASSAHVEVAHVA